MSVFEILFVATVVAAFVVFGVVLAWAERQTRNLPRQTTLQAVRPSSSAVGATIVPLRKEAA